MLPCRLVRRFIDAYVDDELEPSARMEIESHLLACPRCKEELDRLRLWKITFRNALRTPPAPPHLRKLLFSQIEKVPPLKDSLSGQGPFQSFFLNTQSGSRPSARRPGWRGIVLGGVLASTIAVGGGLWLAQTKDEQPALFPVFEEVAHRHTSHHPVEVRGSPKELSEWLRAKLPFRVQPIAFSSSPSASLIGARLSSIGANDAATFYYDVGGRRLTVVVFAPPPQFKTDANIRPQAREIRVGNHRIFLGEAKGYTIPLVERDGLVYGFAGDLDKHLLIQLVSSMESLP
ncbi:MAG: zf-HC2 domain-containing protein [Sandaracinaceae bacterium]|nr:zf-HC2 domain-containing protein [Sandaracinaceae bacterium]